MSREDSLVTVSGKLMSKVDIYKWRVQDERGALRTLPKDVLMVDHSYQRNANEAKIKAIARDWSWVACGAIVVADRGCGFYVIDGQHRVLAAKRRSDIEHLPCIVFKTTEVKQEAKGFLTAQTQRRPVTATEKFKVLVAVEDEAAILVDNLIASSGRCVNGTLNASSIKCVRLLLDHAKTNRELLIEVWPLIIELCHGKPIGKKLVEGLLYIAKRMPAGQKITTGEWRKRILKIGADELVESANKASAYYAKGSAKVWGVGMVDAINKGLRNRLELINTKE